MFFSHLKKFSLGSPPATSVLEVEKLATERTKGISEQASQTLI
jgi:hypothetical protein